MEVLRFLVGALTRNWGLKLLALALAIVIYHSMKPAGKQSRAHDYGNDRNFFQENR